MVLFFIIGTIIFFDAPQEAAETPSWRATKTRKRKPPRNSPLYGKMPRKIKIFRKLAFKLAKLLPTKDLEDITKSKKDFEKAVENGKVKVGSFKIKKNRFLGKGISKEAPDPNQTSPKIEAELAELREKISRLGVNHVAKNELDPKMWNAFVFDVPGTCVCRAVITNGMTLVFEGDLPEPRDVRTLGTLKGAALLAMLKEVHKWLERKKFIGPYPLSMREIDGKPFRFDNTFCVSKPPGEDGEIRWRSIIDGSVYSDYFKHTAVKYPKHKEIVRMFARLNYAWKTDIAGGYKNVIRSKDQREFCAFVADGKIYVDRSMAMGYAPMCKLFSEVVQGFILALIKKFPLLFTDEDVQLLLSYIDDIFGGDEDEEMANLQLLVVLFMGRILGFKWNYEKVNWAHPKQEILGVIYDLTAKVIFMQKERLDEGKNIGRRFNTYFRWTRELVETFVGLCIWYATCMPTIIPHLESFTDVLRIMVKKGVTVINKFDHPRLRYRVERDLKIILKTLAEHKPLTFDYFTGSLPRSKITLFSDASCVDARPWVDPEGQDYYGMGGWFEGFAWRWSNEDLATFAHECGYHGFESWGIARLELLALILTEVLAREKLPGFFHIQRTDNMNVRAWMRKKRCKFDPLDILLQEIFRVRAEKNYRVQTYYISSEKNTLADLLSRDPTVEYVSVRGRRVKVTDKPGRVFLEWFFKKAAALDGVFFLHC